MRHIRVGRGVDDLPVKSIKFGAKIQKQLGKRGWSRKSVEDTVNHPHRTVGTKDTRYLAGGGRKNDPATAYINKDGSYVVLNDNTNEIVQVSNRYDPHWISPF